MQTENGDPRTAGTPTIRSVQHALRILKCFSFERPELGITEIAGELGLHKSTVHRIMATMADEGFVERESSGRYTLGWRLFELGEAVHSRWSSGKLARETLETLVAQIGETAHLAVLDDSQVLYIEKVESPRMLRMPSSVGRRDPAHCTALGKVLLASLDEAALLSLIYGHPLVSLTPNTITDPDQLREEVRRVREQGFAVDREEYEIGLMCVAAPILDDTGRTCGAISIAGPTSRIQDSLDKHVSAVREACRVLSAQSGTSVRMLKEACSAPASLEA